MTGLAAAFQAYGARGKNPRWSWSARTPDGQIVMTFWNDQFRREGSRLVYSTIGRSDLPEWQDLPGNRERIENLLWARDHCDGFLKVVVVIAEDPNASQRKIADSYPRRNLLMKLTDLNESTGEFSAISVDA
jgi:hypothetical protein